MAVMAAALPAPVLDALLAACGADPPPPSPGTGSIHARLRAGCQVRRPAGPPGTGPMPGVTGRLLGAYAARPGHPAGLDTRQGAGRRWPAAAIGRRAAGPATPAGSGRAAVTAGMPPAHQYDVRRLIIITTPDSAGPAAAGPGYTGMGYPGR
jgi:hypothetical protein